MGAVVAFWSMNKADDDFVIQVEVYAGCGRGVWNRSERSTHFVDSEDVVGLVAYAPVRGALIRVIPPVAALIEQDAS